jgi:putative membrane protein
MPAFAATAPVSGSIFWDSQETAAITEEDLAAAMAAAVKGTDEVSEGAEKEETVYVFTDAYGKQKSMTVSNWLKNKEGSDKLYDNSILQNIENVKGDEPFTQNGDILTWNAGGNDIYYQGTTDKAAPISQKITYYLDGKEIAPEDLAGKSGKVKIHLDYDNSEKYSDVFVPFTTMTGIIFSNDNVKNVEIDSGSVISEGKNTVVVGMAFPGLSDSLQSAKDDAEHLLDETEASQKSKDRVRDLEIPDSVEITMDATDFKMSTCMTMVFSGLFDDDEELEEDHDSMLKDMDEKIADLEKDGADLADGAGKLSDGINEATDGSKELADGAGELASGIKEYTDGVSQVNDGADQLADGTDTLVEQLPELTSGLNTYTQGVAQADAGLGKLVDSLPELTGGDQLHGVGDPLSTGDRLDTPFDVLYRLLCHYSASGCKFASSAAPIASSGCMMSTPIARRYLSLNFSIAALRVSSVLSMILPSDLMLRPTSGYVDAMNSRNSVS